LSSTTPWPWPWWTARRPAWPCWLEPLLGDRQLRRHHRLHAVHAHLLEMDSREGEARVAYATAARLATSIPEQRYLNDKAALGEERHG
jgi:predicted RNA polymerase sigma factor